MKRVWKREGESYTQRLEEAYTEMLQSEDGQELVNQFKERINKSQKEIKSSMEKKIIELTNIEGQGWDCLLCCKEDATTEVNITRPKHGDSVIKFRVCNNCLAQMQKDMEARQ